MKNKDRGEHREAWHRMTTRCAARIRAQRGATLDKETAEKIARVFRAALLPRKKAGRKPDRETVRAAAIWTRFSSRKSLLKRQQRRLWQRIYPFTGSGCYRSCPPTRPGGVPGSAVWAGGLDGGGWVTCSVEAHSDPNVCTIYDEEGRTQGPARYRLKKLNRAARTEELRFTYVTGQAIGLENGLELTQTCPKQTAQ